MNTASTENSIKPLSRHQTTDLSTLQEGSLLRDTLTATVDRLTAETDPGLRSKVDWFGLVELLHDAFQFCTETLDWSDYVDGGTPWIEFSIELDGLSLYFEGSLDTDRRQGARFENPWRFSADLVRNGQRFPLGTLGRDQFVALLH